MANTTEKKSNWGTLGGNNGMHKFSGTGPQEAGQSSQEGSSGQRGTSKPYKATGGPTGQGYSSSTTNKYGAGPQEPGCSSQHGARQEGFAHGGKTPMHGNTGSRRAIAGQTSQ